MLELCRCPNIYGPDCTYIYKTRAGKMSRNAHGNFELQIKKIKKGEKVSFGRIRGFHKNLLIKPSSSDPNAPNSN